VVLLVSMGVSRADAEDAAQEAMIQAWQQWESIHEPAAWVRTVAVRIYLKRARMKANQTLSLGESGHEPATGTELGIFVEEQQQVLRLLRRLPPQQRTVVAMHYDEATCEEIANTLEISAGTVRSQLRHARKKLKEMMESGGLWHPVFRSGAGALHDRLR
jgi:RNA polymerase sigma factor (sigma-70 family)